MAMGISLFAMLLLLHLVQNHIILSLVMSLCKMGDIRRTRPMDRDLFWLYALTVKGTECNRREIQGREGA
jgi:hypothetical protein